MTDREAMKMALDALEWHVSQTRPIQKTTETIEALRQALAQPEIPMSPEHLPQYIATNNIKPTTEGGGGAGGAQPEQEPVAYVKKLNTMIIGCDDVINEDGVHEDAKKLAKLVKKDCYEILRSLEEKT